MSTEAESRQTAPDVDMRSRLGASPVAWGFCDAPGWGAFMGIDQALSDMRDLGYGGAELSAEALFPSGFEAAARTLDRYGMSPIGVFLGITLHDQPLPSDGPVAGVLRSLRPGGGKHAIIAADWAESDTPGPAHLTEDQWSVLIRNADRLCDIGSDYGVTVSIHPHAGTAVLEDKHVRQLLDSSRIGLCLDTGHALIGASDPRQLVLDYPGRTSHVHLKDVDAALATQVATGQLGYMDAVRAGMIKNLGEGDVDIVGVVAALESQGYPGWYVLEHETMLGDYPNAAGEPQASNTHDFNYLVRSLTQTSEEGRK